jgi:hypothetical protein
MVNVKHSRSFILNFCEFSRIFGRFLRSRNTVKYKRDCELTTKQRIHLRHSRVAQQNIGGKINRLPALAF